MVLGTQSGSLLIKDGLLQRGCECCEPPVVTSCEQCCDDYPDEIQVEIASDEVEVCYSCQIVFGGTQFFCAVTAPFSVSGTYTLTRVESLTEACAVYTHTSCNGGNPVEISVSSVIQDGVCRWLCVVGVGRSVGSPGGAPPFCLQCDGAYRYGTSGQSSQVAFAVSQTGGCGFSGSAVAAFPVGFSGGTCGQPGVVCSECGAGTVVSPSGCVAATLTCNLTLTV